MTAAGAGGDESRPLSQSHEHQGDPSWAPLTPQLIAGQLCHLDGDGGGEEECEGEWFIMYLSLLIGKQTVEGHIA